MKIAVYAICKNEEQFVDRCLQSCLDADYICISDTGSTDGTLAKLREWEARSHRGEIKPRVIVSEIQIKPWYFDDARNVSLSFVPEDVDFCIPIDLDEVMVDPWRPNLERAINMTPSATRVHYWFTWSWNKDWIEPGVKFVQDKIHARHGYKWLFHCHETLTYEGDGEERFAEALDVDIYHFPDKSKSRSQYLPLLQATARDFPEYDRPAYYLGREYYFANLYTHAIGELQRYLNLPTATWKEERSQAMVYVSKSFYATGNNALALDWAYRAIAESRRRETWLNLAELVYWIQPSDYTCALWALKMLLNTPEYNTAYLNEPTTRSSYVYDLAAVCAYHTGNIQEAITYTKQALVLDPTNERLLANLALYTLTT